MVLGLAGLGVLGGAVAAADVLQADHRVVLVRLVTFLNFEFLTLLVHVIFDKTESLDVLLVILGRSRHYHIAQKLIIVGIVQMVLSLNTRGRRPWLKL